MKNHKNGLSTDEATELLQLLRACAHATPPKSEEDLPVDHYYQLAWLAVNDNSHQFGQAILKLESG